MDAKLQFHEIEIEVNISGYSRFHNAASGPAGYPSGRNSIQGLSDDATEDTADDEENKEEQQTV